MKNLLLFACFIISSSSAFAQTTFTQTNNDVKFVDGKAVPTVTVYTEKDFKQSKFGVNLFTLVTQGWAEALVGPYYRINKSSTIGISAGLETSTKNLRLGSSFTYLGEKTSLLMFLEKGNGNDNYWYSVSGTYQSKKMIYGVMAQRFYGVGPTVGYNLSESITLTGAPLYDIEEKKLKPTVFLKIVL